MYYSHENLSTDKWCEQKDKQKPESDSDILHLFFLNPLYYCVKAHVGDANLFQLLSRLPTPFAILHSSKWVSSSGAEATKKLTSF